MAISTHNGTHLDAPYHFFSTMNHALKPGGEPSWRIDEVPLEWCFQPGVKLDFRHLRTAMSRTPGDVEAELKRIGHDVAAAGDRGGQYRAPARATARTITSIPAAAWARPPRMWLLERGVRLVGTDGWSWDAPFCLTRQRVRQTGDAGLIWEGHRAGREIGYSHLEKLHNLEALPADGFEVVCFPVKVHRGSAGWTRAVAIIND